MNVRPIPACYHTVTPYLSVCGAAELIEYLKNAFAAEELEKVSVPGGAIAHAELKIGDSRLMICDVAGDCQPQNGAFYLYLEDVDASYRRSLKAGATSIMEPSDQFWGDRMAKVVDRFGNEWQLATRVEEVSPEELQRRLAERFKQ